MFNRSHLRLGDLFSTAVSRFSSQVGLLVLAVILTPLAVNAQEKTGPEPTSEGPVTTTTLHKKADPVESLNTWFDEYSQNQQVTAPKETLVEGYQALGYYIVAEGTLQRALAVDLGNGQVVTQLSTNRKAGTDELFSTAKPFISEALTMNLASTQDSIACNCVLYARSQVPSLPYGLTYYADKLAIINHRFPRIGSVAVIQVMSGSNAVYGHVAVVRNVTINFDGSLSVTLQEANWSACQITWRTGNPDSLNIRGYFDPAYASGSASPRLDSLSPSSGPAGRQFWTTAYGINFDPYSVQAVLLGGSYCNSFSKCVVPNNVIKNKTTTSEYVPLTLGAGTYYLYLYNKTSGKTSNGKPIVIK